MSPRKKWNSPSRNLKQIVRLMADKLCAAIRFTALNILVPIARHVGQRVVNRVRRQIKKYRRWWRITNRSYRFYVIGHAIMLVWLCLFTITRGATWLFAVLLAGAIMCFLGFTIWSKPIVQKIVGSWWGKWVFAVVHGFFLIFAAVYARFAVREALQMPPQYFDLTVGLVTLITYIPVFLVACALFTILLFAVTLSLWGTLKLLSHAVYSLIIPFLGRPKSINRMLTKLEMLANKAFFHAMGMVVVTLALGMALDGFGVISRYAPPGIRWFAYIADFQPAGRYPGIPCDGRVRLQDNGVVAVAQIVNNDIVFNMVNFKADADVSRGCTLSARFAK